MASYGVFLAVCGFEYHGPKGHIGFAPRLKPADFKAAFTAAEGWGTFAQTRQGHTQSCTIDMQYGQLCLNSIALAVAEKTVVRQVLINDQVKPFHQQDQRVVIDLDMPMMVHADETVEIGTIHLTLRELKNTDRALLEKLERKISAKHWVRLISANANIHVLTFILRYMDRSFREELQDTLRELSLHEWQALLFRGDFKGLCLSVRWYPRFFSTQFTKTFLKSLKPTFETLIRRDSWEALREGEEFLRGARKSHIKQTLSVLLHDYAATIEISSLHFESFDETAFSLDILWFL